MSNVTIKMIAEKANVSRGTVDRVLNNRPDVSEKTRKKVLAIAKELDFTPNILAKALKSQEKKLSIGIIVSPKTNNYGKDVFKGVLAAQAEYRNRGINVQIYGMNDFSVEGQLGQVKKAMADGVVGLALAPMQDDRITDLLQKVKATMPVVTYNTTIHQLDELCYIGQDGRACGRVAAQLLGMLSGGQGDTIVYLGFEMVQGHIDRGQGFTEYVQQHFPGMHVVGTYETLEKDEKVIELTRDLVRRYPIRNIFLSGGGIDGLGQILQEENLAGKVNVVCTDYICGTEELLKKDVVQFAIGQQPFEQGYYPIKVLADYLLYGVRPSKREIYTNLDIRIKENIGHEFSESLFYTQKKKREENIETEQYTGLEK